MRFPSLLPARWQDPRFRVAQTDKIHTMRFAAAFLTSQLIATLSGVPHAVWMSVTVVVIMGALPHTGSIIEKARQRFLGTAIGAVAGVIAILLGHLSPWLSGIWVLGAAAYAAWLAIGRGGYIALLSAITLAIVSSSDDLEMGLWRISNVFAGVLIAILFAHLVPTRAKEHWLVLLCDNLADLATLHAGVERGSGLDVATVERINRRILGERGLLEATRRESALPAGELQHMLRLQRGMLTSIEFLYGELRETLAHDDDDGDAAMAPSPLDAAFGALAERLSVPLGDRATVGLVRETPHLHWIRDRLCSQLGDLQATLEVWLPRLQA